MANEPPLIIIWVGRSSFLDHPIALALATSMSSWHIEDLGYSKMSEWVENNIKNNLVLVHSYLAWVEY